MAWTCLELVGEELCEASQVVDGIVNVDASLEEEAVLHLHTVAQ
jgi:hypothetical protein